MKIPEFIPFHFDKFNKNLFAKHGPIGVGRWCMIRKAVAEMPTLTIDLNDISDRESLELDSGCSENELTELLDYAAQRGMIDAQLYATGILWIENLESDLGRFFTTGKRNLPKKPPLRGKIPISDSDFKEKFHEVEPLQGIPTHETKRNETDVTIREETNAILKIPKIDLCQFAREFASVYGIAGKVNANETAMAQTFIRIRARDATITDEEIAAGILAAAKLSRKYDEKKQSMRLNPDTWLNERQYEVDWQSQIDSYKAPKKEEKAAFYQALHSDTTSEFADL